VAISADAVAIPTMVDIAATTTLFSVAYGALLKSLPWPEADRIHARHRYQRRSRLLASLAW
jgi:hypothetical protein